MFQDIEKNQLIWYAHIQRMGVKKLARKGFSLSSDAGKTEKILERGHVKSR